MNDKAAPTMSDEAALDRFGTLTANGTIGARTTTSAVQLSFEIIGPWAKVASNNGAVKKITGEFLLEARNFFGSVKCSLQNAQNGFNFAKAAVELCDSLLEGRKEEEIQGLIAEMRNTANQAHTEASETAKMFRANRVNFNKVNDQIPDAQSDIEARQARARDSKRRADRREGMVHKIPLLGKKLAKSEAKEQESQLTLYKEASGTLDKTTKTLESLLPQLDLLANYWLEMVTELDNLSGRVARLRNNPTLLDLKVTGLKRDWQKVRAEYFSYKAELERLQDTNSGFRAIMRGTGPTNITPSITSGIRHRNNSL